MQIDIEKLIYGGDGLARIDGEVVLTPYVIGGETAEVEREPKRGGTARARLMDIVKPSTDRVAAPCPYFGRCGGCHYQHLNYEAQVQAKRAILIETLARTGKIADLPEISVVTGEPWGYRNRIQLHFDRGRVGYREMRSHDLCAIDHCPISSPKLNECIATLNRMTRSRQWPKFLRTAELFTDETAVQFHVLETERPLAQRFFDWLKDEMPGLIAGALDYQGMRVSYGSFFQVNRFLVEALKDVVIADARAEFALDLYAGVGLFSVPLALRSERLVAVESGTGATRDLRANAERAGVAAEVIESTVDSYLSQLQDVPDVVIADPPRTGLGKSAVQSLIRLRPREIVIVACDPATLARDAQMLLANGYEIETLVLVDLFPQTYHIETVMRLRLR